MPIFVAFAALVLAAFVALAAATTVRYVRRDLLHPIVLVNAIFAYYVLVPAAYLLATGMRAFPTRFDIAHPTRALTVALAVLLGMYVLILVAFRRAPQLNVTTEETAIDMLADANLGILLLTGLAGFAVGVTAYTAYVWLNGGIVRMFTVTPRTAFYHVPNTLRFKTAGMLGVFGGWATVLCALRPVLERRTSPLSTSVSQKAVAILAVTTAIALFVAVSTRARMVVLVPLCMLVLYLWTAGWFSRRLLVGVGVAVVAVGISFSLVESVLLGRSTVTLADLLTRPIHMPRFALVMVLVESVPGQVSVQWGATLPHAFSLNLPGFPRYGDLLERIAIGVDKKHHTSSAMFPGELWLNFGPVGIVVGGVIYGAALRWSYRLRESASTLVRGVQPALFVCVLLLWPTNLTWGVSRLFVRFLVPVMLAVLATLAIQRWLPSLARAVHDRRETGDWR